MKKYKLDKQVFLCYNYSVLKRARSPVDRTLASGAESGSSTLPERTSKTRISIVPSPPFFLLSIASQGGNLIE